MRVSKNMISAVETRNIPNVRSCLWSAIVFDKNMTGSFKDSLEYVVGNGISERDLFEEDDGAVFDEFPTADNYHRLGGLLRVNFSREKLESLMRMGCTLWPPVAADEHDGDDKSRPAGIEDDGNEKFGLAWLLSKLFAWFNDLLVRR